MTRWLVTGGAGYIGSHVVRELLASGRDVVVLDDFSTGRDRRLLPEVPVVRTPLQNQGAVTKALTDFQIDGVVHLAAKKAAGESVTMPLYYFSENVGGMLSLLAAMEDAGTSALVYSSSAAVYGTPERNPVPESAPLIPESPYGETKVVGEWLARDAAHAWGLSVSCLRYFNVAGAGADVLGDNSVNNLIPMVFAALDRGERPQIFGADYQTPDGTCIRDYIHVSDLASAHVGAAAQCEDGARTDVFNVGRGLGASVREVMEMIERVTGRELNPEVTERRAGDPPATWAATEHIAEVLGWHAQQDLHAMVASAWSAWQAYPADV